jgi:cell division protein FtsQ
VSRDRDDQAAPDPAALDELLQAFSADPGGADEPEPFDDEFSAFDADDGAEDTARDDSGGTTHALITIADDDLPDPVYLDGDLGGPADRSSGSGAVVYIEDDDTGDALVPGRGGRLGPGIEPRMRDRRMAVRQAEGRRRLKWFVVAGVVVAVVVAVLALLGSSWFSVERSQLTITGNVYTDDAALAEIVDDLVGTPVLLVDAQAIERRIEQIPWVDSARVSARFPRRASIEIRERTALATYQGPDGRFRVIDREARVLDVIEGQPIAYMLVTGPDALDLTPGQFASAGYAAAAELVQALTASVRGRTASIDVTGDGSQLRMFLDDGTEIRFGAADDLLVKLVRVETVLPTADQRGASIIDVSTAQVTLQ